MRHLATEFQERIGRNEATFRQINEDIERGRDAEDDSTLIGFVCECGMNDCARLIELTPAEYEQVRSDPCRFAILNGHEIPSVESVVERHERYAVVRKFVESGDVVTRTDPRS